MKMDAGRAVIDGRLGVRIVQRGLQARRQEHDLVHRRAVVGVHGLWLNRSLILI
jgi:hypothetical protein